VHRMSRIVVVALAGLMALPAVAAASDIVVLNATTTSQTQKGKKVTFVESLKLGKKNAGVDRIVCTVISGANYNCRGTYTFSNGTITVAGRVNARARNNQVRVTGGTKTYKTAGGVLKLHTIDNIHTRETFEFNDG
jgi:hypothetical protein